MSKLTKLNWKETGCNATNLIEKENAKMSATLDTLFNMNLKKFHFDSKKNCYIDNTKKVVVSIRESEKNIALQVNVASEFETLTNCKHRNKSEDVVIDGVTYVRVMHVWALATKIHVYIDEPVALNMLQDCYEVAQKLATDLHCINDSDKLFCNYAYRFELKSKEFDKLDTLADYIDSIANARVATYVAEKTEA
jgi:hypothetical protein